MRRSRFAVLLIVAAVACAGAPKPKVYGTSPDLTPTVEVLGKDRLPTHLRIQLPQAAQVAAFYVVPGQGTQMLYPVDSTGSKALSPGVQDVATSFAIRPVVIDTSRLLRRPQRAQAEIPENPAPSQRSGGPYQEASYIVVYASRDSLSYKTLNDRVIGITLPGYSDEAINTVTKLVHGASTGSGTWTAVAVPFRP